MATTTSTTKAKTKTSKKPSVKTASAKTTKTSTKAKTTRKAPAKAKTTKATAAAKTKKPVAKSTATAKAAVKKPTVSTARRFHSGYLFAGVALAIQAVLAGLLMKADSAQVFLGHLTKNELASTTTTVLAPAAHPLYELEFRWLLVVFLGVSAVFALLRGTRWLARETAGVTAGVQPTRWLDFAVTGAIAFELVALLNGLQDAVGLKLGMLSIAASAYFAWVYEREKAVAGKGSRATLVASQLTAVFPVVALIATMWGTYLYGIVRSPWYAYAAAAVFTLGLILVNTSLKRSATAGKHDYLNIDSRYTLHNTLIKIALGTILIVGLYAKK